MTTRLASKVLFVLACLLLFTSCFIAIGPGHRYSSHLVDSQGNIDRDAVLDGDKSEQIRDLYDIELQLKWLERVFSASNSSTGFLLSSWLLLACAYGLSMRSSRSRQVLPTSSVNADQGEYKKDQQ